MHLDRFGPASWAFLEVSWADCQWMRGNLKIIQSLLWEKASIEEGCKVNLGEIFPKPRPCFVAGAKKRLFYRPLRLACPFLISLKANLHANFLPIYASRLGIARFLVKDLLLCCWKQSYWVDSVFCTNVLWLLFESNFSKVHLRMFLSRNFPCNNRFGKVPF